MIGTANESAEPERESGSTGKPAISTTRASIQPSLDVAVFSETFCIRETVGIPLARDREYIQGVVGSNPIAHPNFSRLDFRF